MLIYHPFRSHIDLVHFASFALNPSSPFRSIYYTKTVHSDAIIVYACHFSFHILVLPAVYPLKWAFCREAGIQMHIQSGHKNCHWIKARNIIIWIDYCTNDYGLFCVERGAYSPSYTHSLIHTPTVITRRMVNLQSAHQTCFTSVPKFDSNQFNIFSHLPRNHLNSSHGRYRKLTGLDNYDIFGIVRPIYDKNEQSEYK